MHLPTELQNTSKIGRTKRKTKEIHIVGDFNTPFSLINRTNRQKISKD